MHSTFNLVIPHYCGFQPIMNGNEIKNNVYCSDFVGIWIVSTMHFPYKADVLIDVWMILGSSQARHMCRRYDTRWICLSKYYFTSPKPCSAFNPVPTRLQQCNFSIHDSISGISSQLVHIAGPQNTHSSLRATAHQDEDRQMSVLVVHDLKQCRTFFRITLYTTSSS